ncbi:MAG: hypothetical protein E4G94_03555 [ANME-2 cluster archaeon]|nr:MAG: hypothetical protein E4G94_03555 [ANME-2 cluster archaeon]
MLFRLISKRGGCSSNYNGYQSTGFGIDLSAGVGCWLPNPVVGLWCSWVGAGVLAVDAGVYDVNSRKK